MITENFLGPLTPPLLEPLGIWGLVLLVVFILAGSVLILPRLWKGYRDMRPPVEQD